MSNEKRYLEVAKDMNLFFNSDSAGVVYWKPEGFKLYENLKNFSRVNHEENQYLEVRSPSIVVSALFEQSGHSAKYKDYMFLLNNEENGYALRPMSCPNHILIYNSEQRSYKDLPLPIFEFGEVFRNEPSGSLQILFRQRQFCQDDSHVFVSEKDIIDSLSRFINMSREMYYELGFKEMDYIISLRPNERFGDDSLWDRAENHLREACNINGLKFKEVENDGAFYGPKLEIQVKDQLGRSWQLGVIQLDYVLPERFDLSFINDKNEKERPVILHHAVLGSLERMVGILLESFGKNIPEFLHPIKSVVIPVSDNVLDYGKILGKKLNCKVDESNVPLGKKIRNWKIKGVPNIYVVGEKEKELYDLDGTVSVSLNNKPTILS